MAEGKKRTLHVPKDWVDDVREVLAANAQLLDLARKQRHLKP
jgi:hypothetical protein